MKRREFLTALAGGAVAWPDLGFAQQARTPKRVGFIGHSQFPPVTRFRETLRKLGWVEGDNLVIEFHYGEGRDDRFPEFAAELVSMPVDVLVVWGTLAAFAAKRATTTNPILIAGAGDVVNTGLVSNLARPDANLTGFIALNVDLESKRLELLKEAVPGLSRVVVLANPANPLNRINLDIARRSVEKLGVKIEVVEAKSAVDIDGALAQIKKSRLASDTLLLSKRKEIADFMAEQRIPAIYPFREYAGVGGLFVYGANISVLFERAAEYLDRLLKGEKVGNLPVQQATDFELIVNTRTASALGLTVPPSVLLRADDVVE
ncbi:MAG: ABC transporter substrate-binding protein [Pseudolabrys sp.]